MSNSRFTLKEMQLKISDIMNCDIKILPIGNHELNRHLVYRVITEQDEFVFKSYYQSHFASREIASLKSLKSSGIHVPNLIAYGVDDDQKWMIMNYLKGIPLTKVLHHIPREKQLELFREMGTELAKMHSYKTFDFFGEWDEDCSPYQTHDNFHDAFLASTERTFSIINSRKIPHDTFMQKGNAIFNDLKNILYNVSESHHTHLDYDARNIHVLKNEGTWHLNGIFDFEQSKPWDKNADFVHLYLKHFYEDRELEDAFFSGYLDILSLDEDFNTKLNFYMLYQCLSICSWAFNTAPTYYNKALSVLKILIKTM